MSYSLEVNKPLKPPDTVKQMNVFLIHIFISSCHKMLPEGHLASKQIKLTKILRIVTI